MPEKSIIGLTAGVTYWTVSEAFASVFHTFPISPHTSVEATPARVPRSCTSICRGRTCLETIACWYGIAKLDQDVIP
jgi:hypothetical protein